VSGKVSSIILSVPAVTGSRRRPKITATLDPDLLASVDAYVAAHPDLDRSAVIDEALRLWRARELELAMEAQFASPDGVDPNERQAWDQFRRAAVARQPGTESDPT
jgi:Arc/MetJ-type ribon-helix-helix transcriptional regulator